MILKRSPFFAGDPRLTTAGVVHVHRQPGHGFVVAGGNGRSVVPEFLLHFRPHARVAWIGDVLVFTLAKRDRALGGRDHAIEAALLNEVQLARRHPVALIVADGNFIVRSHGAAVGSAETRRNDVQLRSIIEHAQHGALVRR